MKLLLFDTPLHDPLRTACEAPPLGIAYLAAAAREQGHDVRIFHGDPTRSGRESPAEMAAVATHSPCDVVGISTSTSGFKAAIELAERIHVARPDCRIVFGGHHATATHREILECYPVIDAVVRGEGEETLCDFLARLGDGTSLESVFGLSYREGLRIVVNPPRPVTEELDRLPYPARDLCRPPSAYPPFYDLERGRALRMATMISSRGCPYHCSFCSIRAFYRGGGKTWRPRSPESVASEIEMLMTDYGVEFISFVDDNFFVQPHRALAIFELLRERGRRVDFAFATRVDQVLKGRDVLPELRRAGCRRIELGLEHGSQAALDRLSKGVSVGDNAEALGVLRRNGILVKCDWIMFDPGTTLEDLQAGMSFVRDHGLDMQFPPIVYTSMDLLPGTDAYQDMVASGRAEASICRPPRWEFSTPRVTEVFTQAQRFLEEFQMGIGGLINEIEDAYLAEMSRGQSPRRPGSSTWRGNEVTRNRALQALVLKRRPFRVFEGLLEAGLAGKPVETAYAELTRDLPGQLRRCREMMAVENSRMDSVRREECEIVPLEQTEPREALEESDR